MRKNIVHTYDGAGIKQNLMVSGLALPDGVYIGGEKAYATGYLKSEGRIEAEHGALISAKNGGRKGFLSCLLFV